MKAFNNALKTYDTEEAAYRVAWAAVKRKYYKNKNGRWVSYANANSYDTTSSSKSDSSTTTESDTD